MWKFLLFLFSINCFAQNLVERLNPPYWWVNMNNTQLQLLVYGKDIAQCQLTLVSDKAILKSVETVENPNYLFLNLEIYKTATAGNLNFLFSKNGLTQQINYQLKKRERGKNNPPQALSPADFIYLIMPDRFSNGDSLNDVIENTAETTLNRDSMYYRHGGDLQGIINHLDYLKDLGITALWLNPVIENNQPYESYHGYAATDHYIIDPRLGTNTLYFKLIDECHKRGIKMVQDVVHNHIGDHHWLYKDLPAKNWLHNWPEYTRPNYRATTLFDPYVAQADKQQMVEGWFDTHMPDLNQDNPHVANYLTQNNIWWIEQGIDAFRLDTYAYSDPDFLPLWWKRVTDEYPNFFAFGETWVHGNATQNYYHGQNKIKTDFNSGLPALTDFQLYYAINEALTQPQGWTSGTARLYYTLAKDYQIENPYNNILFLDNHDLSRFYSMVNNDLDLFKMGIGWLMTMRGIPCMYYGTEILMQNFSDPDGKVREDFPGGWANDSLNLFNPSNRIGNKKLAFDYIQKLAKWRATNQAITKGKLKHYIPENGVYVYFRMYDNQQVMVIMNTNNTTQNLQFKRFKKNVTPYQKAYNVIEDKQITLPQNMALSPKSIYILQIQ